MYRADEFVGLLLAVVGPMSANQNIVTKTRSRGGGCVMSPWQTVPACWAVKRT